MTINDLSFQMSAGFKLISAIIKAPLKDIKMLTHSLLVKLLLAPAV
jgi:hypothetical protein